MKRQTSFAVKLLQTLALVGLFGAAGSMPSYAFDPRTIEEGQASPDEAFRFGAQAYKFGNKSTAVQALTYAAHNGHMASQWKLGRMYEEGDGVVKDPGQAFDLFNGIVKQYGDAQPGSVEARYVSNAIVKLSSFVRTGIVGKLTPDPGKARDFLQYAASYFRDPDAQYHLAMSYLDQSDGKIEPKMAARWLSKAARKGHVPAQLELGEMLLEGNILPRQPVNGLKWLTIARTLDSTNPEVLDRQEAAFALADEATRKKAVALASEWLEKGGD
nr:tetratricopeptide repeat protein [uncultured Cohaesibacter sp.]